MAIMKWVIVDGDKMTLMEKKIRNQIKQCESEIRGNTECLEIQYEKLLHSVDIKSEGDRFIQIGKEMEEARDKMRQLKERKKMLEYFLNDELEA